MSYWLRNEITKAMNEFLLIGRPTVMPPKQSSHGGQVHIRNQSSLSLHLITFTNSQETYSTRKEIDYQPMLLLNTLQNESTNKASHTETKSNDPDQKKHRGTEECI